MNERRHVMPVFQTLTQFPEVWLALLWHPLVKIQQGHSTKAISMLYSKPSIFSRSALNQQSLIQALSLLKSVLHFWSTANAAQCEVELDGDECRMSLRWSEMSQHPANLNVSLNDVILNLGGPKQQLGSFQDPSVIYLRFFSRGSEYIIAEKRSWLESPTTSSWPQMMD